MSPRKFFNIALPLLLMAAISTLARFYKPAERVTLDQVALGDTRAAVEAKLGAPKSKDSVRHGGLVCRDYYEKGVFWAEVVYNNEGVVVGVCGGLGAVLQAGSGVLKIGDPLSDAVRILGPPIGSSDTLIVSFPHRVRLICESRTITAIRLGNWAAQ